VSLQFGDGKKVVEKGGSRRGVEQGARNEFITEKWGGGEVDASFLFSKPNIFITLCSLSPIMLFCYFYTKFS
jgi:hypothetical protein